jgi:hypothetical protein
VDFDYTPPAGLELIAVLQHDTGTLVVSASEPATAAVSYYDDTAIAPGTDFVSDGNLPRFYAIWFEDEPIVDEPTQSTPFTTISNSILSSIFDSKSSSIN